MFGSRSKLVRTVPSGRLRRAPEGKVSDNYEHINTVIGDDEVGIEQKPEVLPTILPREPERPPRINYAQLGVNPHTVPKGNNWSNLFVPLGMKIKSTADLKRKRKRMLLPRNNEGVVDVDGDGNIDEVEIKLSTILKHIEGEDLDGDGHISREETEVARVAKGKEIYARTFLDENPGIRNFYKMYRYLTDEQIVDAIVTAPDFRMNMHNMMNLGAQYKLAGSERLFHAIAGQITGRQQDMEAREQERREKRLQLFRQSRARQIENFRRQSKSVTFRKRFKDMSFRRVAHETSRAVNIIGRK